MDANLSEFDKVVERSGEMKQIKFLAASLLSLSIFALHVTAPQRHVVYIPAVKEDYKVRPVGLQTPVPLTVSLEEANQRYNKKHRNQTKIDDVSYHDECWFKNCDLELELKLAKVIVANFFIEQP